jgi:uncharacterized protein (DUF934 family)
MIWIIYLLLAPEHFGRLLRRVGDILQGTLGHAAQPGLAAAGRPNMNVGVLVEHAE